MQFKTISTVVHEMDRCQTALDLSIELARQTGAHLQIICLGIERGASGFYYQDFGSVALKLDLQQAQEQAIEAERAVKTHLENSGILWSTHSVVLLSSTISSYLTQEIKFSDLVVLPKPETSDGNSVENAIMETALFDAHQPVLMVPDGVRFNGTFERVVVGWDEGQEALTSIRKSLPILQDADTVDITIVSPPRHSATRSDPGGALAQMLSRHDVHCQISVIARTLPRVSDELCRQAKSTGADLLVMGAYGHSRLRESILGGATKNMLSQAEIPVLFAH